MKVNWNFQRGEGVLRKNLFCGGGMDNLWNYTLDVLCQVVTLNIPYIV